MKPYPKYKDSGVEWIGQVPEGWEVKKIKFLALDKNTLFLDGDWIESKNIVFDDSQIRYITTGNIGEGKYKEQGLGYITDETFKKLNCTEIYPGDLLISRLNPPIGRCCIVPNLGNRIVTSVDNVVLRPDRKYLKQFLKYAMSNSRYFEYTFLIARGATMQRISRGLLGNVELPVSVDAAEQTAVANYLDRKTAEIGGLIANKERLVELYEEEKTAVINQAVTKGLDPDDPMKPSGIEWLGDIPEHWGVKKLKYVAKINDKKLNEKTDPDYQFYYIDIGNVSLGKMTIPEVKVQFQNAPSRARRIVEDGETIISTVRTYLKAISYVDTGKENVIVSTGFAVVSPKTGYNRRYISHLLTCEKIVDKICSLSVGVSYPAINASEVGNIHIWYPLEKDEQAAIVQHIETECSRLDAIIDKFKKQIELLKEYRTTLISEVVTGKIDVRDEVIQ